MKYILGCPSFGRVLEELEEFYVPVSQIELCRNILREPKNDKDRLEEILV